MSPYRQAAPHPDSPACIVCDRFHEYYVSLKHPSGIGSHRVCQSCVDAFKRYHDLTCDVPFCPEWSTSVHYGLALAYCNVWQIGLPGGPLKLCWRVDYSDNYAVRWRRIKTLLCRLVGHKRGWFRCGRCGLKKY